jgi:hypothetical protein
MRHCGQGIFGIGLVIKNGGVQIDVEKNLASRKKMGDGVKVCRKCVLKDSALNGCLTSGLGPEFVGGVTVGSTARGSEYSHPLRLSTYSLTNPPYWFPPRTARHQHSWEAITIHNGYSLKMRPVSIVSSDGYHRRVVLEEY